MGIGILMENWVGIRVLRGVLGEDQCLGGGPNGALGQYLCPGWGSWVGIGVLGERPKEGSWISIGVLGWGSVSWVGASSWWPKWGSRVRGPRRDPGSVSGSWVGTGVLGEGPKSVPVL